MTRKEPDIVVDELAYEVIGAAIEVHRILGPGHLESMYEEAMCVELCLQKIPFVRQKTIAVNYKEQKIGESRLNLIVGDLLVVELKAIESVLPVHHAQLLSYLKITGFELGLLINFNVPVLKSGIKRIVLTK